MEWIGTAQCEIGPTRTRMEILGVVLHALQVRITPSARPKGIQAAVPCPRHLRVAIRSREREDEHDSRLPEHDWA